VTGPCFRRYDEGNGEEVAVAQPLCRGKDFVGLHHIGFWVDDAAEARRQVEAAGAKYWMGEAPQSGNSFYEVKFRDPNGIVFDISAHGWGGASKDGADLVHLFGEMQQTRFIDRRPQSAGVGNAICR